MIQSSNNPIPDDLLEEIMSGPPPGDLRQSIGSSLVDNEMEQGK